MVGRRVLAPVMGVRALLPQPLTVDWPAPSSRGPGHGPLKAETRVRIPLGPPLTGVLLIPTIASPPMSRSTDGVAIAEKKGRAESSGNASTICWAVQAAVGCSVTLTRDRRRRAHHLA